MWENKKQPTRTSSSANILPMLCPACSTQAPPESHFCPNCGHALSTDATQTTFTTTPPTPPDSPSPPPPTPTSEPPPPPP
ncbi:MAG: zinc-ribbon domain-containing protein, partial [Planctomycetota bacterium]